MMKPKISWWLMATLLLAGGPFAEAQEGKKIFWIGYLAGSGSAPNQAFVRGMRDLGCVEGKNIAFVYRTAEGRRERYSDLASDLVRLKVNVIVTDVTGSALALKKATSTIPIVMTSSTDPVGTGLVASLARPGGNVTGLTNVGGEMGENFWSCSKRSHRDSVVRPFWRRGEAPRERMRYLQEIQKFPPGHWEYSLSA